MIPLFPRFKKIELSDKRSIERLTASFPPYSDFNFFSMWIWDTSGKMRISKLNGNLVVLFNDYITGDKFLSFIGNKKVAETATELIAFSKKKLGKNYLKLIPEEVALNFRHKDSPFELKSDRDDADYVYLSEHLGNMHSWKKNNAVATLRRFIKSHPHYKVIETPLSKINKEEYRKVFHKWSKEKTTNDAFDLNEYKAFERFLKLPFKNVFFVSIYIDDVLAGFSAYETLPHRYAIAHFSKGDVVDYPGIYNVLNWEEGRIFHKKGVSFLNWEQDLGVPGIRYAKEKYKPYFLMKKVTVSL